MLKVAITGGIGVGKSTVCKLFEKIGIPVYYSDFWAKELMKTNPNIIKSLKALLGQGVYFPDGELNKDLLRNAIFKDPNLRNQINSIVHPEVKKHGLEWNKTHKSSPYIVKETALLLEAGLQNDFDAIILVTSPLSFRLHNVQKRDNISEKVAMDKIEAQLNQNLYNEIADYIILNDNLHFLQSQTDSIHTQLNKKNMCLYL